MKSVPASQFVAVYNPVLRTIHWLMAALIFLALGLGVVAIQLPIGPLRAELMFLHKSIGVTLLALIALRVLMRLAVGSPPYAAPLGRLVHAAANAGHFLLYVLMVALPVSGYVKQGAAGREISIFGLFTLPNILPEDKALADAAGRAHYVFALAIAVVLALHLAAVFWHARVKGDTVLTRMWPRFRPAR